MPGITPTGPITEHEIKDAVFEIYQQKKERIKKLIYKLGISSYEHPEWDDHYETYKNTEVYIVLEAYDRLQLKHNLLKKRIETLERVLSNKKNVK